MNDITVGSWNELQEQLYAESWNEEIGRFRSNFAFRGLPDARFDLSTGLSRLEGSSLELEGHLLRNFVKYAHRDTLTRGDSEWHWLTLAQHHGLPTRLLDWTYSPFVALHFATGDLESYHADGAIWCVDYVKTHRLLPDKLKNILQAEGSNAFTTEMLAEIGRRIEDFDQLGGDFALFFEPPSLDDRIINQFALFSVMSDSKAALREWLDRHPDLCRRIILPASLKWEVRDKLDQANITERVLFPGLDGLSAWLRRHYTLRRR